MFDEFGFEFGHGLNNQGSNHSQRRNQPPNRQHSHFRRPYDQTNNFSPYNRYHEQAYSRQRQSRNSSRSNTSSNSSTNNNSELNSKTRTCHYEILGIDKTATQKDIKKAYHKQSLIWHPDKNSERLNLAEEKFKLISEAYQVLSDDAQKQKYDDYGFEGPSAETNQSSNQDCFFSEQFNFSPAQPFSHPFFSTQGPPSLFDFFSPNTFSFGSGASFFGSQPFPHRNRSNGVDLDQFFGFGQGEPFHDPFGPFNSFSSPFSMFSSMHSMSSHFSGFPHIASMTGNSSGSSTSTSTSYVNGRSTTHIQTVDSNGKVTTEVRFD